MNEKNVAVAFLLQHQPRTILLQKKIAQKCLTVAERGAKVQTASTMGRDRSILLRHS